MSYTFSTTEIYLSTTDTITWITSGKLPWSFESDTPAISPGYLLPIFWASSKDDFHSIVTKSA